MNASYVSAASVRSFIHPPLTLFSCSAHSQLLMVWHARRLRRKWLNLHAKVNQHREIIASVRSCLNSDIQFPLYSLNFPLVKWRNHCYKFYWRVSETKSKGCLHFINRISSSGTTIYCIAVELEGGCVYYTSHRSSLQDLLSLSFC